MQPRRPALTLVLLASLAPLACRIDTAADDESETTSTSTSESPSESESATEAAPESDGASTPGETTSGETAPSETGDDVEGASCQAELQDCPDGYKCLLRRGAADWEFVCLPVLGDAGVGEACNHDGVIAGTDDCDQESWCIGPFDPNGSPWTGLCYPFCVGGSCEDAGDRCVGIGNLPVCAPICDPLLAGSCAGQGEACIYRAPEGFVCFPTGSEGAGLGEPCATAVSCEAGLHCSANVPGCAADEYCCTEYCDTTAANPACTVEGAQCAAIGATDPSQAHVGACVNPG